MSVLADRLIEVHDALCSAQLPHAFGGAIALAYCTEEPRGTRDLDVNVFVEPARAHEVLGALPAGVTVTEADIETAQRIGQVRVWLEDTPIDIFLDTIPLHTEAAAEVRQVEFSNREIPVLGCTALVVFKALFDRTKDWADIEEIVAAGALDGVNATRWVRRLVGSEDHIARRLTALVNS